MGARKCSRGELGIKFVCLLKQQWRRVRDSSYDDDEKEPVLRKNTTTVERQSSDDALMAMMMAKTKEMLKEKVIGYNMSETIERWRFDSEAARKGTKCVVIDP